MTMTVERRNLVRRILAIGGVAFGVLTLFAGGRVLLAGADPGYVVYRPLLVFNTMMGVAYIVVGAALWRAVHWSARAAGTMVVVNLAVLVVIGVLYATGGAVAVDSLRAMAFRSVIWFVLWLVATRP
jgi:hypothetical protein